MEHIISKAGCAFLIRVILEHIILEHIILEHIILEHIILEHIILEHIILEHIILEHISPALCLVGFIRLVVFVSFAPYVLTYICICLNI